MSAFLSLHRSKYMTFKLHISSEHDCTAPEDVHQGLEQSGLSGQPLSSAVVAEQHVGQEGGGAFDSEGLMGGSQEGG